MSAGMTTPGQPLQTCATCCHLSEKRYMFRNITVYLQRDSRNERFENMRNEALKNSENRICGHLPKRIHGPSETLLSGNPMNRIYKCSMAPCRHSSPVHNGVTPQNRICDNRLLHAIMQAEDAVVKSAWKLKME